MSKFPIIQIPVPGENESESILEGAIDKYWLELPDLGRSLVKVDNRGAWVEKVVATLAKKVELPVARYELAERDDGSKLIVSPSFLLGDGQETTGEKLLVDALGRNYLYTPKAIRKDGSVMSEQNLQLNFWKQVAID